MLFTSSKQINNSNKLLSVSHFLVTIVASAWDFVSILPSAFTIVASVVSVDVVYKLKVLNFRMEFICFELYLGQWIWVMLECNPIVVSTDIFQRCVNNVQVFEYFFSKSMKICKFVPWRKTQSILFPMKIKSTRSLARFIRFDYPPRQSIFPLVRLSRF